MLPSPRSTARKPTPLLAALPERERRILLLRFFGNMIRSLIAAQVGLSQITCPGY
jgi:DNA-directed RNA polymerase specialized sigma subunit